MIPRKMMLHSLAVHRLRRMNLHSLPEIGHLEYTQGQKLAKWMGEACPMWFFSWWISRLIFSAYLWQYEYNGHAWIRWVPPPLKFMNVPWKRDHFRRNLVFQPPFLGDVCCWFWGGLVFFFSKTCCSTFYCLPKKDAVEKQTTLTLIFQKKQKAAAFHPGKQFDWKTNGNLEGFFSMSILQFVYPLDVIPILWVTFYG